MSVPASAVLLLHNPHGGFPIAAGQGGVSQAAAHALDYDGRKGDYEDDGGFDRAPTERDLQLAGARQMSGEAARHLDYAARSGAWEGGTSTMEDCSYWGQRGPLTRGEIELDMLACGGCFLKSVVSVDRRHAAELGLDSKAALQELVRDNWQDMMAAAGAAGRPEDVHWYACYHDDAENSLHVHICTWAADGRIGPGWHPSARDTRAQKEMLYRDAFAAVRQQRNLEHDYYRMLLPRLAAVEMGDYVSAKDAGKLRAKAARAGIAEVPLARTLDARGAAAVAEKADAIAEELRAGRGLRARNFKLQARAAEAVNALKAHSPAFDAALARYRQLVEINADLKGLAIAETTEGAAPNAHEQAARDVIRHERDRFVRRAMDDMMRRIRNQVIRSADPSERVRAHARGEARALRSKLVTASLFHPERLGLPPEEADRLRVIYQDAAREFIEAECGSRAGIPEPDEGELEERLSQTPPGREMTARPAEGDPGERSNPIARERAAEAALIIARSPMAQDAVREAAARIDLESGGAIPMRDARSYIAGALATELADAIEWRFGKGLVNPRFIDHDRLPTRDERALARDMVERAVATRGMSLGLPRATGEKMAREVEAARAAYAATGDRGSDEVRNHAARAAELIAASPVMRYELQRALGRAIALNPGSRMPDPAYVGLSAEAAVERRIVAFISRQDGQKAPGRGDPVEPWALDAVALAGIVAAAIVRGRDRGGPSPAASKRGKDRAHGRDRQGRPSHRDR